MGWRKTNTENQRERRCSTCGRGHVLTQDWHTIHGCRFGFFNRLVFVSELCPRHPVLSLFLLQTLLQGLQFVVQVDLQVVLFLQRRSYNQGT